MPAIKITFIGFGEVGSIISAALSQKGAAVYAYDILLEQKNGLENLRNRARSEKIVFLPLADAVSRADLILSVVTTDVAKEAAQACADYLDTGQIFLDLNATAPSLKKLIAQSILSSGADFVEGAILGAIGVTGTRTHILTAGKRGAETAETLTQLGLNATYYSPEIGKASTFKMLRSIFSKGLEALILELLIAGRRAGIQEDLWQEINGLFAKNTFDIIAGNWVKTHAVAHERRYHEMKQVAAVLREMDIEPLLTACTEAFFERSCKLGLKEVFPEKPDSIDEVVGFMEKQLN